MHEHINFKEILEGHWSWRQGQQRGQVCVGRGLPLPAGPPQRSGVSALENFQTSDTLAAESCNACIVGV